MVTVTTHSIKRMFVRTVDCSQHKMHMPVHGSSEWDIIFHASFHELTFSFLSYLTSVVEINQEHYSILHVGDKLNEWQL